MAEESFSIEMVTDVSDFTDDIDSKRTSPHMTKYEYTRLIAARSLQLASGCEPLVKIGPNDTDTIEIARRELCERVIPLVIRRFFPDGSVETWYVKDMHIRDY